MRISDWSSDVCSSDLGQIDTHVLVDRRAIDIDVDLLRMRGEGIEATGDAIIEPRAQRHDQIGLVHRHIGLERAVHPEHAEPLFRGGGRSEEHTSELQSLMRTSYAVFCLKKKKQ